MFRGDINSIYNSLELKSDGEKYGFQVMLFKNQIIDKVS